MISKAELLSTLVYGVKLCSFFCLFLFDFMLYFVMLIWSYSKTRGMGAARKIKKDRTKQRWADKTYKKAHQGNEWNKPFQTTSHALRKCKSLQTNIELAFFI